MSVADNLPPPDDEMRSSSGVSQVRILRVSPQEQIPKNDRVVVEAPLEFQLHHPAIGPDPISFGTTMRTPGEDEWLAAGLLYGEAVVNQAADIDSVETSTRRPNVVNVRLHHSVDFELQVTPRRFSAGSSCGVCGTTGLDSAIARAAATRIPKTGAIDRALLFELPARMRAAQAKFADTGGIHATALFDFDGNLLDLTEDVGRHNAFDKLVGKNLLAGRLPLHERIVLLSGRASFELTQKALRAGVGILAAIGAPSSLAVNLAIASGLTLAGFLRGTHCNVYSHPERLGLTESALTGGN